jgi:two-component system NtrC family sensor kinase
MITRVKKFFFNLSPKFRTLKFRLMMLITITLLLVVGVPLAFLINQLDENYRVFSTNMIETTSQLVYQSIYEGMMVNNPELIQRGLETMSKEPNIKLLRIYTPAGEILFSSRKAEINSNIFNQHDEVFLAPNSRKAQETFIRVDNTYGHLHPIYVQEECLPCHQNKGSVIAVMDVQVGLTQQENLYASAKQLTIFSALVIVVILWIILNFLYQGQIESRLKIIINGFNELSRGNLDTKINMPGRHELAMLAQEFNETVSKLKKAKENEDQFVQENLERADRLVTLGEVAAEIAHEVNNPASILLVRAEYIKDELLEDNSQAKYIEDINIIIQQTKKIAEITRNILHYARKLPQTFADTDLNDVIQQSINILKPRINKKNVVVRFRRNRNPVIVKGNSTQLEQVFCNLINNSVDLFPNGKGEIAIRIQPKIKNKIPETYRITYEDNGPGVPEEYRDKIFSPFFTTKKDGKGTGLGLFISRNIITNHHGEIYLSTEQTPGATFIIELEARNARN